MWTSHIAQARIGTHWLKREEFNSVKWLPADEVVIEQFK